MGLWKEHFHPSVLLRWEVLGWILGMLIAVAAVLLFFDQYLGANMCFSLSAVFVFSKITHAASISADSTWHRLLFTFVLCGLCGVAIVETLRGVNSWAARRAPLEQLQQKSDSKALEPSPDKPQVQNSATAAETRNSSGPARTESPLRGPNNKPMVATTPSPSQDEDQILIKDALELARKIAQLQDDCFTETRKEQDRIRKELDGATTEEERGQIRARIAAAVKVVSWRALGFYKDRYRTDAIAIRDALLNKLPKGSRMEAIEATYENAAMCVHFSVIADDLRRLARLMQSEIK
jgi:hypothetical protein